MTAGAGWAAFLDERPLAVLATVGPDGAPHATPVEIVVRDGRCYAWVQSRSVKARNAAREGRATILGYKGQRGVLVRGPARLLGAADPRYDELTRAFLDKYAREETFGNDTLIEVTAERVSEWS